MAHGDHDFYVPVEDARARHHHFVQGSNQEVWYAELPASQHGFDAVASWRFTAAIEGLDALLEAHFTQVRK